jgi:3-dehydroquinate synthase
MSALLDPVVVVSDAVGAYEVVFDDLDRLADHLARAGVAPGGALIVSDSNVAPLYLDRVSSALAGAGWSPAGHVVPPGEQSKSADALATVYDAALAAGVERGDAVIALGGGVVGDLAGYAAATWLRGISIVHLPTTVVSQCDSSIGGKAGINHAGGKNMVGAFWPPRLVLADISTLETLPEREFQSGLAEVVKHALLDGPAFVEALETSWDRLAQRSPEVLGPTIRRAAAVKAAIVTADEREAGSRAVLNLGHTFAHAIESGGGFQHLHGEAVARGLRAALHLSASLATGRALAVDAPLPAPFDRADALAARLPTGPPVRATVNELLAAASVDKKRQAGRPRYVVLDAIGWPRVADDVPVEMVAAAWNRVVAAASGD